MLHFSFGIKVCKLYLICKQIIELNEVHILFTGSTHYETMDPKIHFQAKVYEVLHVLKVYVFYEGLKIWKNIHHRFDVT